VRTTVLSAAARASSACKHLITALLRQSNIDRKTYRMYIASESLGNAVAAFLQASSVFLLSSQSSSSSSSSSQSSQSSLPSSSSSSSSSAGTAPSDDSVGGPSPDDVWGGTCLLFLVFHYYYYYILLAVVLLLVCVCVCVCVFQLFPQSDGLWICGSIYLSLYLDRYSRSIVLVLCTHLSLFRSLSCPFSHFCSYCVCHTLTHPPPHTSFLTSFFPPSSTYPTPLCLSMSLSILRTLSLCLSLSLLLLLYLSLSLYMYLSLLQCLSLSLLSLLSQLKHIKTVLWPELAETVQGLLQAAMEFKRKLDDRRLSGRTSPSTAGVRVCSHLLSLSLSLSLVLSLSIYLSLSCSRFLPIFISVSIAIVMSLCVHVCA
jgi:hypothetical protein